jgi:predicted Zn-ribbon and HTH transcriptional regulator
MKNSGRCQKCQSNKIASYREGLVGESHELLRKRRSYIRLNQKVDSTEQVAKLATLHRDIERLEEKLSIRRFVCAGCGYSETYFSSPDLLDDEEMAKRLGVSWKSPPTGVYR